MSGPTTSSPKAVFNSIVSVKKRLATPSAVLELPSISRDLVLIPVCVIESVNRLVQGNEAERQTILSLQAKLARLQQMAPDQLDR